MADIMVIEDDELMRDMMMLILERQDHKVIGAENGKQAEHLLKQHKVDLVITDILMPVQEGMETIMILKHEYPDVKIIAMTGGGKTNPDIYLKIAKKMGVHRTLKKPFKHKELMEAVNHVLNN